MKTRIEQQMDFISETDKVKDIFRQTYVGEKLRNENDAEHMWHLALMAMTLEEYANAPVNLGHVMELVVVHDLVEIDAGDTYAFDPEANRTKRERELKAADRIYNILPKDQAEHFRALWDEFEDEKTDDAKFAVALDMFHPLLMNNNGNGAAWRDHHVTEKDVMGRVEKMRPGSEALYQYCLSVIKKNIEKGNIIGKR